MRKNLDAALEAQDAKKLAAGFERASHLSPDPAWNTATPSWSGIAQEGIAAAKAGDFDAAQATCKACHRAFRKQYKDTHRLDPLPL